MKRELLVVKRCATHIKGIAFFPTNMVVGVFLATMIIFFPTPGFSDVAGYFSHILNVVELTKRGNPPAIQAKVQDKVEVMDSIRTGSYSKAAINFIDESSLVISPESHVIIDKYLFDPNKSHRQTRLSLLRGLFHIIIRRTIQAEEPDFIVNTYTAVLGQRGTAWYTISETTFTDVFCEQGKISIKENQLKEQVAVIGYQASRVWKGQKPLNPLPITSEDLSFLKSLLDSGLPLRYEPGDNPVELLKNLKAQSSAKIPDWVSPPTPNVQPSFRPTPGPGSLPPVSPPPTAGPAHSPHPR